MAIDPKATMQTAKAQAHRARKSAGRILVSGIGFSAAYFLDHEHGRARRAQAKEFIGHATRYLSVKRAQRHRSSGAVTVATEPLSARAAFQRAVEGGRSAQ